MGRAPTHEIPPASVACVGILQSQFTRMRIGYFLDLHQKDSGNWALIHRYSRDNILPNVGTITLLRHIS